MTVSSGARSSTSGDGSNKVFTATFRAKLTSAIGVVLVDTTTEVVTAQVLDTDYTAALDSNGLPTITFVTAPASGKTVIVYPLPTYSQANSITPGGPLFGSSVEASVDDILNLIQGLQDQIGQCLRVPQGDTALAELGTADARASTTLTFDANGVPTLV